jgi:sigma-B regulation protein RsbU (phosphoserine phosphatase)
VYIDRTHKQLVYAGARISLYVSDGQDVREIRGGKRALGDKRMGEYENVVLPLASGTTFYLVTDGFLDQAGGEHGYGFGSQRFETMLREHASRSLADQAAAFSQTLAEYQGARPQRDDITVLSFRFDQS